MLRLRTSSQTIANALLAAVFCQDAKIKNMPYRCYPLKGLSKPNSCTLLETARDEHFNASFSGENFQSLWDYCENNWEEVDLLACIRFEKFDNSGIPVNAVVEKVMPKNESEVVDLGLL